MSRGKCPVDDALEVVVCDEGRANNESRELLDALACEGLASLRAIQRLGGGVGISGFPRLERARDALAAFEKAIGLEYPRD